MTASSGSASTTTKIVIFPEEFMSLRDRPYFDEILARVREEKKGIFLNDK